MTPSRRTTKNNALALSCGLSSSRALGHALSAFILLTIFSGRTFADPSIEDAVKRGEYVFHSAAGCSCHIDPERDDGSLSGGRPLKTPFGTYYSTNISPDKTYGIGNWSAADFYRAMTEGKRPDGANYFPVFPYTSYTNMKRADVEDLWVYLQTLKPSSRANKTHDVPFPFSIRASVTPWRWLYFRSGPYVPDLAKAQEWNRGAYLVNGPGHCSECHTPRNVMGAVVKSKFLGGTEKGPDGDPVPNITPAEMGLGAWDEADFSYYMKTGMLPDGDFVGKGMSELIDHGYKHLSDADLSAIFTYLKSVPPFP